MASKRKIQIPDFVKYLGIAMALVAVAAAIIFWANRGSQVRLEGDVVKSRVIPNEDGSTMVVLELRVRNPASVAFLAREVRLKAAMPSGEEVDGLSITQNDLDQVLGYQKVNGPRFNPVLHGKERLNPGASTDRTVAAYFPRTPPEIEARKGFVVEVEDVDGAITRIEEKRAGKH